MKTNSQQGMFWVIFTLSVAIFPQTVSMPPHLVPLIVLPITWRLVAEFRGWKPAPMLIRVSATGISVFALVVTYGGLMGRRSAVSLLTLMLSLKLLETFRIRDARVVASLSLFLCATQFLFSQGIPMLFYAGLVLTGALVSLVFLQRREAFLPKGAAPPSGHSIFAELGYSTRLMAMAVPVALALFVLFPRWGSPLWGIPERALDARSGLSQTMSPGSIQNLFMDDSPAFRADFTGASPAQNGLYWRGPVFWNFDGREWSGNYFSRHLRAQTRPPVSLGSWRYTIQMEPTEQHWLFALDYPAIVPRGVRLTMDYQLYSSRSITQLKSYEMVSNPNFVDSTNLISTHRIAALNLPAGFNPQTRNLINRWRAQTPSDADFVNRVLNYFNQQEFHYTLNPPLLSRHTVDEFLFDTRSGFCEHYASAFTVMMRMAGIPARVVTGYQGGWYNDFGSYVLVRQSDAHAWSEVWLPKSGWTRIDPTAAVAPSRIERGALDALNSRRHLFDFSWLRSLRNGFDLVQRSWNQWVISFGAERQLKLFMPFGMGELDTTRLVAIMVAAIVTIALLMMPAILRFKLRTATDPAGKLWQLLRRKLAKAGVKTQASMTPGELNMAVYDQLARQSEQVKNISSLYTQIRYAAAGPEISELERAVKDFRPHRRDHPASPGEEHD